ncbi:MAG: hypothetical protein HY297_04840 [Thaumarchaeota archaeon]|nr:hypothetical protein [Nitrososphaerota archaeon]
MIRAHTALRGWVGIRRKRATTFGYFDDSIGGGTAGTANTYTGDKCNANGLGDSSPAGLCTN